MDIEKVEGNSTGKQCDWCCYFYPGSNFTEDIYAERCNGCVRFRKRHFYDLGSFSMRFINGDRFRVFTPFDEGISDDQIDATIRQKYFKSTLV